MTEFDVNPVPETTMDTFVEPTGTSFGETEVIASGVVTGVVLPPTPEVEPEVAGDEPQPTRRDERTIHTPRRRKPIGRETQMFMRSADYRNYFSLAR
jgi:hypothetical protein